MDGSDTDTQSLIWASHRPLPSLHFLLSYSAVELPRIRPTIPLELMPDSFRKLGSILEASVETFRGSAGDDCDVFSGGGPMGEFASFSLVSTTGTPVLEAGRSGVVDWKIASWEASKDEVTLCWPREFRLSRAVTLDV